MPALSPKEFAARAGCDLAMVARLHALELIGGDGALFDESDVNRVRLVLALHEAGLALPTLAAAIASGQLSLDFAGQLMFEPVQLTEERAGPLLEALDLPPAIARRLRGAMGLSDLSAAQALREDDLELMQMIAAARAAGLSDDSLARVLRVFGQSVRRTVEAMRDLFRSQVEEPTLADGMNRGAMLAATAAIRLKLQRLGFRALFLLQRRLLEDAVFDNVVTRIQEVLQEDGMMPATDRAAPTVLFADLAGYTALTHALGDAEAAEQAAGFEALAYETAISHGGQFIKALGDGVMLLFTDAAAAVEAGFALRDGVWAAQGAALRIGLATGPVVPRDGDIFGRTVNLAARIVAEAQEGEILACEDTVTATKGRFAARRLAPATLKGFEAAPQLYVLTGAGRATARGGR